MGLLFDRTRPNNTQDGWDCRWSLEGAPGRQAHARASPGAAQGETRRSREEHPRADSRRRWQRSLREAPHGVAKVGRDKRALKLAKRKLGTHGRGKKKREEMGELIRKIAAKGRTAA